MDKITFVPRDESFIIEFNRVKDRVIYEDLGCTLDWGEHMTINLQDVHMMISKQGTIDIKIEQEELKEVALGIAEEIKEIYREQFNIKWRRHSR